MEIDASALIDSERRVLTYLADQDAKYQQAFCAFHEIAAALSLTVPDVADACRRLAFRGCVMVNAQESGEQNHFADLLERGKVYAADLRRLPEIEKAKAAEQRIETVKAVGKGALDDARKIIVGVAIGTIMLIVGLIVGRYSATWFPPTPAPSNSPTTQTAPAPATSQAAPTSQP